MIHENIILDAVAAIRNAQGAFSEAMTEIERLGITFKMPTKEEEGSAWIIRRNINEDVSLLGVPVHKKSAHVKIQVSSIMRDIKPIMHNLAESLSPVGGALSFPFALGMEKRHTGFIFHLMGHNLKNCLDAKSDKSTTMAKVITRLSLLNDAGKGDDGVYRLGGHTYRAAQPADAIWLNLVLSAPKTDPLKRKKPKPLPALYRVWEHNDVMDMQKNLYNEKG